MLFSSVSRVETFTSNSRMRNPRPPHPPNGDFHDYQHQEIELLLSSSPPVHVPDSPTNRSRRSSTEIYDDDHASNFSSNDNDKSIHDRNPDDGDDRQGSNSPFKNPVLPFLKQLSKSKLKTGESEVLEFEKVVVTFKPPSQQFPDGSSVSKGGGLLSTLLSVAFVEDVVEGSVLKLRIYLPDTSPIDLKVSDNATVEESIISLLKEFADNYAEESECDIHTHAPQCYELRLHEGDGEPDEDFPALDRTRQVKNFGEGDEFEYCLCLIPGIAVPELILVNEDDDKEAEVEAEVETKNGNITKLGSNIIGRTRIKVHLPSKNHTNVDATPGHRVYDLLNKVTSKQLKYSSIVTETFEFHVNDEDKKRLGLVTNVLELDLDVKSLNVSELFLRTKVFADDPQMQRVVKHSTRRDNHNGRPDLESFMFDDISAGRYKEYNVIKRNNIGRRQERRMGIDDVKIYNMKRTGTGGLNRKVFNAFRLMTTVKTIEFAKKESGYFDSDPETDDFCSFVIVFKEEGKEDREGRTIVWECENKGVCAEIVAKIKYLVNKNKQKSLLMELTKRGNYNVG